MQPGPSPNLLLNLFGKHGPPAHNSFVVTFAHEFTAGRRPSVTGDGDIALLLAQNVARAPIGRTRRRKLRGLSDVLRCWSARTL
jgi:hypothetical protein